MRVTSFTVILFVFVIINLMVKSACVQSQVMMSGQRSDMLVLGGMMLLHQSGKSINRFNAHHGKRTLRDAIIEAEPENTTPENTSPEKTIKQPSGFDDDLTVISGQVAGLFVRVQGERVVFQKNNKSSLLKTENEHGRLLNTMEYYGIKTINDDAYSTEFIPIDSTAEPVRVNKVPDSLPVFTGIDLIDQNPAMNRVNQQARKQLASLLLAVGELTESLYSRSLDSRSLEVPHINKIDNEDEDVDIVFELGGQLYSTEALDDVPQEVKEREGSIELIYENEVLMLFVPDDSSDGFLRKLSFRVRKCGNGDKNDDKKDNGSGSDEQSEQTQTTNSETTEENSIQTEDADITESKIKNPNLDLSTISAGKTESAYTPPPIEMIEAKLNRLSPESPEFKIGFDVVLLYNQFGNCASEKMPEFISKINEHLQPRVADTKEMATARQHIRQIFYEFTFGFHQHLEEVDKNHSEALRLAHASQLFAVLAQHELPEVACQYAIKSLVYATAAVTDETLETATTGITVATVRSIVKNWPDQALELIRCNLQHMKQCTKQEIIQLICNAVQSHLAITDHYNPLSWEILNTVHSDALKIPPEDGGNELGFYWDLYQSFCMAFKNEQLREKDTAQAAFYNRLGLQALYEGIRHEVPSACWYAGLLKVGLSVSLFDPHLRTKEGVELFDCNLSENYFNLCAQLKLKQPFKSCSEVERQNYSEFEKLALLKKHECTNFRNLSYSCMERLFGGFLFDKDIDKAEALLQLIPGYCDWYKIGKRLNSKKLQPSVKALTNYQHTHYSDSITSELQLLSAKLLFFRGVAAEQRKDLDTAKICFFASSAAGFAGGYTKLAQYADNFKGARELLSVASDKGDISGWQLMGGIQLGKNKIPTARECYRQAVEVFLRYDLGEEADEIQELLDQLGQDEPVQEPISLQETFQKALQTKKPKKNKKKKNKATAKASPPKAKTDPPSIDTPSIDTQSEQIMQSAEASSLIVKDDAHESLTTTEISIAAQLPASVTPSAACPRLPELTIKPRITDRFGHWAEQMMVMHNDIPLILRHEKLIMESQYDPHAMLEDANISSLLKLLEQNRLARSLETHLNGLTWLALRVNMDDHRSTLFCNTIAIKRHHAEANMQKHLLRQLEQGDVQTVEILITRNPCNEDKLSVGSGGCWKRLLNMISGYPETRWHIRFIKPNGRHRHPIKQEKFSASRTILAFDNKQDTPIIWAKGVRNPSWLQEQVRESLEQPNLSYSVVPTRNPEKIRAYYNDVSIDKFTPEKFDKNSHFPSNNSLFNQ